MSKFRRRRCCICPELFRPDPRVGARQKTCGKTACQKARRAKVQAIWRQKNPDYFTERRLRNRVEKATSVAPRPPPSPRLPPPWQCLPWDLIQAELGVMTADVLALILRLLTVHLSRFQGIDSS